MRDVAMFILCTAWEYAFHKVLQQMADTFSLCCCGCCCYCGRLRCDHHWLLMLATPLIFTQVHHGRMNAVCPVRKLTSLQPAVPISAFFLRVRITSGCGGGAATAAAAAAAAEMPRAGIRRRRRRNGYAIIS